MTADNHPEPESSVLGVRIRSARVAASMSVRELSRRIGVSPSHVSQVERGLASFSVRALYNVAGELGMSMDSLFGDTPVEAAVGTPEALVTARVDGPDPLVEKGIVLRAEDRPTIPLAGGTRWERLTPRQESGAEFIEVVYPPAPADGSRAIDFIQHSSREYGIVTSGALTVQVGFERAVLYAGDSLAFDSVVPHRFWNDTAEEVRAVWFILDSAREASDDSPSSHARSSGTQGGGH